MITLHKDFQQRSKEAGCTDIQMKAGQRLVELAVQDMTGMDVRPVEQNPKLLRVKAPKWTVRAFVQLKGQDVIVHGVLPRDSHTYNVAEEWK